MPFSKQQNLLIFIAILYAGIPIASTECLKNVGAKKHILLGMNNGRIPKLINSWCYCLFLNSGQPARQDLCFHGELYDVARDIVNCTNLQDFKKLLNPHDFCDGLRERICTSASTPITGGPVCSSTTNSPSLTIVNHPEPSSNDHNIRWALLFLVTAVVLIGCATIIGVLYFRARRNNGNLGFRYFNKFENHDNSDSDVIIVV